MVRAAIIVNSRHLRLQREIKHFDFRQLAIPKRLVKCLDQQGVAVAVDGQPVLPLRAAVEQPVGIRTFAGAAG